MKKRWSVLPALAGALLLLASCYPGEVTSVQQLDVVVTTHDDTVTFTNFATYALLDSVVHIDLENALNDSLLDLRRPEALTLQQTMAIGTAGFTAMLSVLALEERGVTPHKGPILVTGAGGGVGGIAVALLAELGYEVWGLTGRESLTDYLTGLGAAGIVPRAEMTEAGRPLATERWAGGIDAVGGQVLVNLLAATRYGGAVAACGLVGGLELPATVMPFILRGVDLLGIESVYCPAPRRSQAWDRLARDLPLDKLDRMTSVHPLAEVPALAAQILAGQIQGRAVIDLDA